MVLKNQCLTLLSSNTHSIYLNVKIACTIKHPISANYDKIQKSVTSPAMLSLTYTVTVGTTKSCNEETNWDYSSLKITVV